LAGSDRSRAAQHLRGNSRKYLYAKKLVRASGEKMFDMIEAEPNRLRKVDRRYLSNNPLWKPRTISSETVPRFREKQRRIVFEGMGESENVLP
jgi:hypothetical protein